MLLLSPSPLLSSLLNMHAFYTDTFKRLLHACAGSANDAIASLSQDARLRERETHFSGIKGTDERTESFFLLSSPLLLVSRERLSLSLSSLSILERSCETDS